MKSRNMITLAKLLKECLLLALWYILREKKLTKTNPSVWPKNKPNNSQRIARNPDNGYFIKMTRALGRTVASEGEISRSRRALRYLEPILMGRSFNGSNRPTERMYEVCTVVTYIAKTKGINARETIREERTSFSSVKASVEAINKPKGRKPRT